MCQIPLKTENFAEIIITLKPSNYITIGTTTTGVHSLFLGHDPLRMYKIEKWHCWMYQFGPSSSVWHIWISKLCWKVTMALYLTNNSNKGFPFQQMPPYWQQWIDNFGAAQRVRCAYAGHGEWKLCGLQNISQNTFHIMFQNKEGRNLKLHTLLLYMSHLDPMFIIYTFWTVETASSSECMRSATHMGSLKDKSCLTYISHVPGIAKRAFEYLKCFIIETTMVRNTTAQELWQYKLKCNNNPLKSCVWSDKC